ncbi:hypothetical protein [Bradyrhizobium sp. Ce-3]|uniref:hypothetical protein n=1 Tax=Bradyrhizobium sp. Ce-3 TaxID=2913970 RepID=UPI001FC84ED6|nr:hypothetical protein [Bradyrhizobium sp. Ce-3]
MSFDGQRHDRVQDVVSDRNRFNNVMALKRKPDSEPIEQTRLGDHFCDLFGEVVGSVLGMVISPVFEENNKGDCCKSESVPSVSRFDRSFHAGSQSHFP